MVGAKLEPRIFRSFTKIKGGEYTQKNNPKGTPRADHTQETSH
jgi:hypothetical protein